MDLNINNLSYNVSKEVCNWVNDFNDNHGTLEKWLANPIVSTGLTVFYTSKIVLRVAQLAVRVLKAAVMMLASMGFLGLAFCSSDFRNRFCKDMKNVAYSLKEVFCGVVIMALNPIAGTMKGFCPSYGIDFEKILTKWDTSLDRDDPECTCVFRMKSVDIPDSPNVLKDRSNVVTWKTEYSEGTTSAGNRETIVLPGVDGFTHFTYQV